MTNEEISLKTKTALAGALKNAMEKKSLSKITVNELVNECHFNRKTFYYHFPDIYHLLKWMLEQEAIEIVKNFDLIVNQEEAIRFVMDYVTENQHIINCAYDSMGREELKRFFYNDLFDISYNVIESTEQKLNLSVEQSFKEFLARFYTEATASILIDWVQNNIDWNHEADKEAVIQDILLISRSSVINILKEKAKQQA